MLQEPRLGGNITAMAINKLIFCHGIFPWSFKQAHPHWSYSAFIPTSPSRDDRHRWLTLSHCHCNLRKRSKPSPSRGARPEAGSITTTTSSLSIFKFVSCFLFLFSVFSVCRHVHRVVSLSDPVTGLFGHFGLNHTHQHV